MSEKTDQEQDPKLDQVLESDEDILADIDSLIAEEDPEFLAQLNKMSSDTTMGQSAAVDGSLNIDSHVEHHFLHFFKQALDYKNNTKPVVIFWSTVFIAIVLILFIWLNNKSIFNQNLFINSFEKLGGTVSDYNPNNETEAFYDNQRFAKNLITLPSIFVNIKASENSGENPMLVFEVTIEGLSSDAIVEIKDRQVEFKDLISRLTEEKKYDDLMSMDGKRDLAAQIQKLVNANLTQGQVRRVFFKNFISNPNN